MTHLIKAKGFCHPDSVEGHTSKTGPDENSETTGHEHANTGAPTDVAKKGANVEEVPNNVKKIHGCHVDVAKHTDLRYEQEEKLRYHPKDMKDAPTKLTKHQIYTAPSLLKK